MSEVENMINYNYGTGEWKNWILEETAFNKNTLGKCESIMCLANGYMGVRSATEESYIKETRNCFVAGTFNKASKYEVTELPNVADVLNLAITINGEDFTLIEGEIRHYSRRLNLKQGELTRDIIWVSPKGDEVAFKFRRVVSMKQLHTIAQSVSMKALNKDLQISLYSTIDGKVTNEGAQHYTIESVRFYEHKLLQLVETTTQSGIDFVVNTTHTFYKDHAPFMPGQVMASGVRSIGCRYTLTLEKGQDLTLEKVSSIHTSRDQEWDTTNYQLGDLKKASMAYLKEEAAKGYRGILNESAHYWEKHIWDRYSIDIQGDADYDSLAVRFAIYHMNSMTPRHDNRMNIAAKGLSGPGYKGHYFWDTEIFVLPFFTFSNQDVARSLLEYRYLSLKGAHDKAKANGYEGAQFPWESAWLDDGEVTPEWGGQDPISGEMVKIWSGFIEQHITADIAYATWQYYQVTQDQDFMDRYGYELIFDTAKFWASRLEWNDDAQVYHINDVVGPDEYKEHIDNNAFTNYLAHWNMELAIEYYDTVKADNMDLFKKLDKKLDLENTYRRWKDRLDKVYLPQPNEDNIIPQNDTYLGLEEIDLTKYKAQDNVGSLFKDYTLKQVNQMKVSKQADVMMLFYLLEDRFDQALKQINFDYYEPLTLHDSSLSLAIHAILANDLNHPEMAYTLFRKATEIDMGTNMQTSDHGIHMAAQGGLWQSIISGFGGMRMLGGRLLIHPRLPKHWDQLVYPIYWKGNRLDITVTHQEVKVVNVTMKDPEIAITICGKDYLLKEELTVQIDAE